MTSQTTKTYRRSASQLNLLTECGMKFYLQKFKKVPERPAAWTIRGNAVHNAVMEWEQSNRELPLVSTALTLYDQYATEALAQYPNPSTWMTTPRTKSLANDIKYRREDTRKQAEEYEAYALSADWEIATLHDGTPAIEVDFSVQLGGVEVVGKIDTILYWPGDDSLTVRDFKTGKEKKRYLQLGLYRYAAKNFLGLDIDYGDYFYTKLNRSSGFIDLRRYNEAYLSMLFSRADTIIQEGLFLPSPGDCDMCPVRSSCPEWEIINE